MNIYFDTEFYELQVHKVTNIHLINIAMVDDRGNTLYLLNKYCDIERCFEDEWLVENVFRKIHKRFCETGKEFERDSNDRIGAFGLSSIRYIFDNYAPTKEQAQQIIVAFCGARPEFWAYYSSRDWVLLNSIFGGMMAMPTHFPQYCYDLKQLLDHKAKDLQISPEALKRRLKITAPEDEHCPLSDAMWNKNLYESLIALK